MDLDPSSFTSNGWLEDTSLVEKYTIADEEYNKREGVRLFLLAKEFLHPFVKFHVGVRPFKKFASVLQWHYHDFKYSFLLMLYQIHSENLKKKRSLKIHHGANRRSVIS